MGLYVARHGNTYICVEAENVRDAEELANEWYWTNFLHEKKYIPWDIRLCENTAVIDESNVSRKRIGMYWYGDGKHQDWVDDISKMMPDMGDTDNNYMNLFIAMSRIYHEIHNNGGINFEDGYYDKELQKITAIVPDFSLTAALDSNEYLENADNKIVEFLMDKNLLFSKCFPDD
jgi:hypothetical protein